MSMFEDLVLIVDTPSASPRNADQMRRLALTSAARHARYTSSSRRRSSTHDKSDTNAELVSAKTRMDNQPRPIRQYDTSQVKEASHSPQPDGPGLESSERSDVRIDLQPVVDSPTPSVPRTRHLGRSPNPRGPVPAKDIPFALRAARRGSAACRAQVTPERVRLFQENIQTVDYASLIPTECKPGTYVEPESGTARHEAWYTVRLVLSAEPGTDLEPRSGNEYRLAVDTGDGSFWVYSKDFMQSVKLNLPPELFPDVDDEVFIHCDWSDANAEFRQKNALRAVIPPSTVLIAEAQRLHYWSGGSLSLMRWPAGQACDIPFVAPAWDWVNGKPGYMEQYKLRFARVLAVAVDKDTAAQGNDGNLGMGVPGYRAPWQNASSTDRATFFDVLNEGVGLVSKPMCLSTRLLAPNGHMLAHANQRVQSFVYYGVGSPCGYLRPGEEKIMLPEYSPPLYIFPDVEFPDHYRWWTLQLLSLTLLEPLHEHSNHETLEPIDWVEMPIPINLQNDGHTMTGIRVLFDSGSMSSVLPQWLLKRIWTEWFHMQEQHYPNSSEEWLYHFRDFSKHDILFQFRDYFGTIHTLRCGAEQFLTSPWEAPGQLGGSMACFVQSYVETGFEEVDEPWILGVNFFWAAMLKLDATHRGERPVPGQSPPFMQLTPQRIVRDGEIVAGPWDLELHAHLPPRMQATLRQQPELRV